MYFSTDFLDHEDGMGSIASHGSHGPHGPHADLSIGGSIVSSGIQGLDINSMNGSMSSHILSCLNCANEFSATNSIRLPRKLFCGHTFCGQCMSTMIVSDNILDGSSFSCAACFQLTRVYGGVDGLPNDMVAMKALKNKNEDNYNYTNSMNSNNNMRNSRPFLCGNCEENGAKFKCQQCEEECAFLCPDCAGKHNEMKAFRRHEIVELSPYMLHQHTMMAQQAQSMRQQSQQGSPTPLQLQQPNYIGQNSVNSTPVRAPVPGDTSASIGYTTFECDIATYDMLTNFNAMKLREIMEQTGCNIYDDDSNGIKIGAKCLGLRGTNYQLDAATRMLKACVPVQSPDNSVFSRLGSSPTAMSIGRGSQRTSVRLITIAREHIDILMNSRGAILNDIMTKSGAQISVKNDALTPIEAENGMMCLQVGGNSGEVEFALSMIKNYTGQSGGTRDNSNPHSPVKTSPSATDSYAGHTFGRDFDIYESVYSNLSASSSPYDQRDQEPLSPNADTLYLECPQEKVKLVIGAKGIVIKSIMRRTKTVIVIDEKFPEGHPRKVEIKGKAENIRAAQQLIQSVIDSGPTSIDEFGELQSRPPNGEFDPKKVDNPGEKIVAIRCPAEKISIVIGAKGVIINEISRRSNTQISIDEDPRNSIAASAQFLLGSSDPPSPESDMSSNFSLRRIEIRGLPADIEVAKGLIEAVVTSGPNVLYSAEIGKNGGELPKPLTKKSIEIPCPKEKVGALIGSKGTIIKEIMRKTNTQISIAEEIIDHDYLDGGVVTTLESRMVNIRGSPEDIELCKTTIEEIIGNEYSQEGKTFSMLSSASPNVSRGSISVGDITSSPLDRAKMPSAFPSLPPQETFETITVPLDRMREIIGIKGVIIKKISSKSGAKIIVNNDLPPGVPRILEIRGTAQQITKAKDLLKGILDSKEVGSSKDSNTSLDIDDKDFLLREKISISPERSRNKIRTIEIINFVAPNSMETILSRKKIIDKIILCSGAEINSRSSDIGSIQLHVEGYSDNVHDAVRLINKLFEDVMENDNTGKITSSLLLQGDQEVRFEIFDCPGPKSSLLTDNKGGNIKEIRRRSGATIVLMKSRHSSPHSSLAYNMTADVWRRVAIIGAIDNVNEAKNLMHALVTKGENAITKSSNNKRGQFGDFCSDDEDDDDDDEFDDDSEYENYSDDDFNGVLDFGDDDDNDDDDADDEGDVNLYHCSIECPNDKVGLVIGFKGVVIKSMMKRSKAKIVVIGTVVNGKTTRVVEITGTEAQVAVARQLVDCVITHGADALDQSGKASMALGIITKYVDVTTDDFKQLAGSLGPGLKTVSHTSNATISVIGPNPKRNEDHNLRRISVKGTQNCVEIALNMIKEAMDRLNIDMNVIVDKDFKHVDDADSVGSPSKDKSPPESPMSASGAAKIVKKGQIATRTVQCPLTRVGTLIGTRGVIVKEIMKRSGATIVVAESSFLDDSDPPVEVREVHIKGSKNAVASAEKIVRSLIEHGTKVLNKGYNEKDDVLKVSSN